MPQTETLRLVVEPSAAAEARHFVRSHATLDSMRYTEADLLVTELVGNAVRHAREADTLTVALSTLPRSPGMRVAVSHSNPTPLDGPTVGVGFTLLDRISQDWGHYHEDGVLTVWFVLRTPGSVAVATEVDDVYLLTHMDEDPAAFSDELIRRHRDLAISIARRYQRKGIATEDLEQVALMALLKAIQRFDPELGDIRPYAAATVSGEMKKLLRDEGWSVRVPRSLQERSLEVLKAVHELTQTLGRSPEIPEISTHLDLTDEEVIDAMNARAAYSSKSIEKPSERTGNTLADHLREVDERLGEVENRLILEEAISQLPARQQRILDLRFNSDLTQSEIAEIIGISQMHVSRLLADALRALRRHVDRNDQHIA